MIIFAKSFNSSRKKIWFFLRENVTIFARKFDDFFRKILQLLQENVTFFSGNSDDFCTKVWRSLQEHLTIFQVNSVCWFLFPVSLRVFYHYNSHPSKTRQILLQKSSNFLVKIAKFSLRICQIFLQTPSNFSTITYLQIFL